MLIIQTFLLISTLTVLRYFWTRNMLNEPIRNYPKNLYWKGFLYQKSEITKDTENL